MTTPTFEIRAMREKEIPQALDIWKETGMQEGTHCLHTWLQIDPLGFNVAVTESGEMLGVCAGVINHDDLAFVGIYAVREKYRGQGIGVKLWKACMEHIGDRNAAVNAVPGKLELYRDRGGFPVEETAWVNTICETLEDVDFNVLSEDVPGIEIRPIGHKELSLVLDYDSTILGYRRDKIIALTLEEVDAKALVALKEGKCCGYGVLKMSIQGCGLVGPLYADNQEIAEVLLRHLMQSQPRAKGLALMIVSTNAGAKSIAAKLGIPEAEDCPRCYKKYKVDVDMDKIFGQLDLNFSPY